MKILNKLEEVFVGIAMIAATGVLFINIILRYFFNENQSWADEFVRYTIIWIAFVGAAICFRQGIHFGVDLLIKSLPEKYRPYLQVYINVMCIIFVILLIYFGFKLVFFSMQTGQTTPSLQISTFWIYLSIPLGATLSLLYLAIDTFKLFKNGKSNGVLEGEN